MIAAMRAQVRVAQNPAYRLARFFSITYRRLFADCATIVTRMAVTLFEVRMRWFPSC